MRTKEQLTTILAKKHSQRMLKKAKWNDLALAIKNETPAQRQKLVDYLMDGKIEKAGRILRNLLIKDVQVKAQDKATLMMADSNLDLTEIDELL